MISSHSSHVMTREIISTIDSNFNNLDNQYKSMPTTKTRKISFNTVIKRQWISGDETPFLEITDVVKYVLSLNKKDKQFEMKDDKFCLLQSAKTETIANETIISGIFKSARHTFRPNLIVIELLGMKELVQRSYLKAMLKKHTLLLSLRKMKYF